MLIPLLLLTAFKIISLVWGMAGLTVQGKISALPKISCSVENNDLLLVQVIPPQQPVKTDSKGRASFGALTVAVKSQ